MSQDIILHALIVVNVLLLLVGIGYAIWSVPNRPKKRRSRRKKSQFWPKARKTLGSIWSAIKRFAVWLWSILRRFFGWIKSRRRRTKDKPDNSSSWGVGKVLAILLILPMLGLTLTSIGSGVAMLTMLEGVGVFGTILVATSFTLAAIFTVTLLLLARLAIR